MRSKNAFSGNNSPGENKWVEPLRAVAPTHVFIHRIDVLCNSKNPYIKERRIKNESKIGIRKLFEVNHC